MPASTAPAAKQAILTALAARPNLVDVHVSFGAPTEGEDVRYEHIYLGNVKIKGRWQTLGAGVRHESYTIALVVVVIKYGDDEQTTEERAFALLNEVSSALVADRTLGGLLYGATAMEDIEQDNTPVTLPGWGARITAQIRCEAMFTP